MLLLLDLMLARVVGGFLWWCCCCWGSCVVLLVAALRCEGLLSMVCWRRSCCCRRANSRVQWFPAENVMLPYYVYVCRYGVS
jgi:hypothetical protein